MRNIIYGDTDSVYVTLKNILDKNPNLKAKELIKISDDIGDKINTSFPKFMKEAFLVSEERGKVIQAGREVVLSLIHI